MDLLKYLPKFEGGGKDKDSAAEHVRTFKEYLAIHNIPTVAACDVEPDWQLIHTHFGYSLAGMAKTGMKITNKLKEVLLIMKQDLII